MAEARQVLTRLTRERDMGLPIMSNERPCQSCRGSVEALGDCAPKLEVWLGVDAPPAQPARNRNANSRGLVTAVKVLMYTTSWL
jgi:hypothetical protein